MTEPTTTCPGCGQQPPAGVQFCPVCGLAVQGTASNLAPVPPPVAVQQPQGETPLPSNKPAPTATRPLVPVLVSGVAIALIAASAVFLAQRSTATPGHGEASPHAVIAIPQSTTTEPTTTDEPTTTEPATTVTTPADPTDEPSAEAALAGQATADMSAVAHLDGAWVSQLSAKRPGKLPNGMIYDYESIWADYQQQVAAHPDALLLRSGDFSTFTYGDFWVIVVPTVYTGPTAANAWCDDQGIDPDDCFAKHLSHTAGPKGASVQRH